ncbi:hypothetical protein H6G89_04775 [Oscillatoria sp. FACHB-1407]|uniref:hypothetical protein n=1 Tax=Oscillatoria sp. FACHB-1407 TaxID=2692847 RepID=UPI001688D72C|nr:hypothetical protein [Oscillatoria sp. FACHB-1407]MBD2460351.1 hypothetical protein [Oscillatoria sp. FACHB-1407]
MQQFLVWGDRRDRIDLAGRLSFGQLTIRQSGRNALVGVGSSALLVLQHVNANVLTRSDFI